MKKPRNTKVNHPMDSNTSIVVSQKRVTLTLRNDNVKVGRALPHSMSTPVLQGVWKQRVFENAVPPVEVKKKGQ